MNQSFRGRQNPGGVIATAVLVAAVFIFIYFNGSPAMDGGLPDGEGMLFAVYIDVGQGDSIFIRSPEGKTMLIDTGEAEYYANVRACLDKYGVENLDYFVVTHPHSDHMGSAWQVVRDYGIGLLIMPEVSNNTSAFERLADMIAEREIRVDKPVAGSEYTLGEAVFMILAPDKTDESNLNNNSVMLLLRYGGIRFMFTGDAEVQEERAMLSNPALSGVSFKADVLKVGHHGSSTSSCEEFLAAVNPAAAVIMCGEDNTYGHPAKDVLNRLDDIGALIIRTDTAGTVTFATDGAKLYHSSSKDVE